MTKEAKEEKAEKPTKVGRPARSLEQEIEAQREKLNKLLSRQREQAQREREKNQRAIVELVKAERLDAISVERWREALPAIKTALGAGPEASA